MTWTTIPDVNVAISSGTDLSHSAGVFTSNGPYAYELTDPQVAPAFGVYFVITLPAGTYTGNVRLTVLTNNLSSAYFHHLFLETDETGTPIPATPPNNVFEYDIGSIEAGDVIYCPAGVEFESGADSGELTFNLEFETEEPPEPLFWTDLVGAEELAGGSIVFDSLPASGSGYIYAQLPLPRALVLQDEMENRILGQLPVAKYRTLPYIMARLPPLSSFVSDSANIIYARLPVPGAALVDDSFTPRVNVISAALPIPFAKIKAGYYGQINAQLPMPSAFAADADGLIFGQLPTPSALAYDSNPFVNYALMVQSPGVMWSYSLDGYHAAEADDEMSAGTSQLMDVWPNIVERVTGSASLSVSARMNAAAEAAAHGESGITWAWHVIASSAAAGADVVSVAKRLAMAIAETMVATGLADRIHTALVSVVEAALVEDMARFGYDADAASEAGAEDAIMTRLEAIASAVSAAVTESTATTSLRMVVTVPDDADFSDSATLQATLFANIEESGSAFITISLGDGETFTAWAMNPSNKAFVEYQNYPFNSFAELDGEYFGINEAGLYVLDGDDDDGDDINAWLRTALSSLGTNRYKRIESAYLMLSRDGQMVLKIFSTSDDNEVVEDWYALREDGPQVMADASFKPGEGIKSVYYAFGLANVDGADFEVDAFALIPIVIDRRY